MIRGDAPFNSVQNGFNYNAKGPWMRSDAPFCGRKPMPNMKEKAYPFSGMNFMVPKELHFKYRNKQD